MKPKEKPKLKTIGADIEWGLVNRDTGDIVDAERTFSRDRAEADKHKVGYDGHHTTGEMRPQYFISGNFTPMYDSIKGALEYINKVINPNIIVIAGCATANNPDEPLGGHIHFGNVDRDLMAKMLPRLDLYMALPLLLMENQEHALTRRRDAHFSRYGQLSEGRRKEFHGGFEYRTPSSFILTPGMTKITMALADIILQGTMRGRLPVFYNVKKYSGKFLDCDKDFFRNAKVNDESVIDRIFRELFKFHFSKRYQMYLASLQGAIKQKHVWDEINDILPKWGVRAQPFIVYNLRDIKCREICQDFMAEKLKRKIYLYGIAQKHEGIDIAVDGHIIKDDFINAISRDYGINMERKTFGSMNAKKASVKIGFSLDMRKNRFYLCKEIFGKIISKAKSRK